MQKNIMAAITVAALMAVLVGPAGATLTTIGQAQYGSGSYNLIWDNDSPFGSIVWLDYSNRGSTWVNQVAWAAGLNLAYTINPSINVTWGGDWRLPTAVASSGFNITTSEMGHLFYTELGNKGYFDTSGNPQPGYGLTNKGEFDNLMSNSYWSVTEYAGRPGLAWYFDSNSGYQGAAAVSNNMLGLAVRSGQVVEGAPVPEPSTMLLLGAGLAGLALCRRRRGH